MNCPYCKIKLTHKIKKTICYNCRWYNESIKEQNKLNKEMQLLKQYVMIPYYWENDDSWKTIGKHNEKS